MQIFQQCDHDRSGKLDLNEGRIAVRTFCQQSGQPAPNDNDIQMVFSQFDYDHSGQLDFGEFKMLLEQLGRIKQYSQQDISSFRNGRDMRIQQYQKGSSCATF